MNKTKLNDIAAYSAMSQVTIYRQNVEKGWHDDARSNAQFICLFHSEVSEGVEGLRKILMDTHLKEYPMIVVEMADTYIRILDHFGMYNVFWNKQYLTERLLTGDRPTDLANLHATLSEAWNMRSNSDIWFYQLQRAAILCWRIVEDEGYDMKEIVEAKVEYNRTRPDHSREHREAEGGKKW